MKDLEGEKLVSQFGVDCRSGNAESGFEIINNGERWPLEPSSDQAACDMWLAVFTDCVSGKRGTSSLTKSKEISKTSNTFCCQGHRGNASHNKSITCALYRLQQQRSLIGDIIMGCFTFGNLRTVLLQKSGEHTLNVTHCHQVSLLDDFTFHNLRPKPTCPANARKPCVCWMASLKTQ